MADAVNTAAQAIRADEGNQYVGEFRNTSDGTGESAVTKIDVSTLQGAPAAICITRIAGACYGMVVKLLWDATTDVIAFACPQDQPFDITFNPPLRNPVASGATGDVQLTTVGHTSGDTYNLMVWGLKCPLT